MSAGLQDVCNCQVNLLYLSNLATASQKTNKSTVLVSHKIIKVSKRIHLHFFLSQKIGKNHLKQQNEQKYLKIKNINSLCYNWGDMLQKIFFIAYSGMIYSEIIQNFLKNFP